MTSSTKTKLVKTLTTGAATLALASALTLAPAAIGVGPIDDVAYAKGKEDKGNNGRGGENRGGGNSEQASKGGNGKASGGGRGQSAGKRKGGGSPFAAIEDLFKPGKSKKAKKVKTRQASASASSTEAIDGLTASQRGKWNSMNASPKALDAHVRNGNTNGPIGAMAQLRTAARLANGEDLSPEEEAFLEGLGVDLTAGEFTDEELEEILNVPFDEIVDADGDGYDDTMPTFEVTDGVAECVAGCDLVDSDDPDFDIDADANETIAGLKSAEQEMEFGEFYDESVARIGDMSNKSYTEDEFDTLLDEISQSQGFDLYEPPAPEPLPEGEELAEAPMDEETPVVTE